MGPITTNYIRGVSGYPGDTSTAPAYVRTVTQQANNQTLWTYTLTHSPLGQLIGESGTGLGGNTESLSYSYDGRGRLASSTTNYAIGGVTPNLTGIYSYDLANNINGGAGWTYDSRNRITSAPAQGGLAGLTSVSYDASGNMTAANGMTLTYDAKNRLSSVSGTPYGTVTFTYDFIGRRASKTVGLVTTDFVYDGYKLIAEVNASTGAVTRSYTWGPLGVIGDCAGGVSRYYLYDGQGNVRTILDSGYNVQARGAYTPYGAPAAPSLQPNTPFAWNGRSGAYTDVETGLILMGARYYAPSVGRFIQADPSGFTAGLDSLHNYCKGDPINLFDASGRSGDSLGGWLDSSPAFGGSVSGFGNAYGNYETGKGNLGSLLAAAAQMGVDAAALVTAPIDPAGEVEDQALKAAAKGAIKGAGNKAKRVVLGETMSRVEQRALDEGAEFIGPWKDFVPGETTDREVWQNYNKAIIKQKFDECYEFIDI